MASPEIVEAFLAERRNAMVVGVRRDGRPHATPNWFLWDGSRFFISTTRKRAKYPIFKRNPVVQLVVDDATGFRCVMIDGRVEILEDIEAEVGRFSALRHKHGAPVAEEQEFIASLRRDERVLLAVTPDKDISQWTSWGLG